MVSLALNIVALFALELISKKASRVFVIVNCINHVFLTGLVILTPFMIYNTIYVGSSLSSIFGPYTEKWLSDSGKEAELEKELESWLIFVCIPASFLALVLQWKFAVKNGDMVPL